MYDVPEFNPETNTYYYLDEKKFEDLQSGVRFHLWYDQSTTRHTHNYFEFFIILEGKVRHIFNDKEEILSAGTLCLIKPNDVHQFIKLGTVKCVHFNCSVTQALFTALCNALSKTLYVNICNTTTMLSYQFKDTEFAYFNHLITILTTLPQEDELQRTITIKTILHNCLFCLIKDDKEKQTYPKWFLAFIDTINTPEYFIRPIASLYKLVPYSQPRLNAYFHQYTNSTLVGYITKLRVNYSCNLLTFSDYPITLIAGMSGYNSVSHYNHTFKKILGISPAAYRNDTRKETTTDA